MWECRRWKTPIQKCVQFDCALEVVVSFERRYAGKSKLLWRRVKVHGKGRVEWTVGYSSSSLTRVCDMAPKSGYRKANEFTDPRRQSEYNRHNQNLIHFQ
jgi:hypothetical protein